MNNPLLSGLRVLDLTRLLPGPFCTLYLAQMGAEVIKIEEPKGGDYSRSLAPEMFATVNRGKRSVTLDLRLEEGVAAFRALAATADVVIESFRPGVMDRLGCGYEALKAINPKLVYAALTGYGHSGPMRDEAGHDINYCGLAGVLDQTGALDGPPVLSGFQVADLAGGALTCALAVLAAVMGARTSGAGCFVDAAMLDGTLALQAITLASVRAMGKSPARGADFLTGALPNYSVYACADDRFIAMGALEPKFWGNFCSAIGRPDLGRRVPPPGPAGAPIRAELTALFKTRTRDEWDAVLQGKDTCVTGILAPEEALASPQAVSRGLVSRDAAGKPQCEFPVRFQGCEPVRVEPAPPAGRDTRAILATVGF